MTQALDDAKDKIRRSLLQEFARMEDDFDATRDLRSTIVDKLMESASKVAILREDGTVNDDTETGLKVLTTALKALSDVEKAQSQAILLKVRQQEADAASSAAAKDRLAVVLKATAPGRIEEDYPSDKLEEQLESMFQAEIKPFELKSSSYDLEE